MSVISNKSLDDKNDYQEDMWKGWDYLHTARFSLFQRKFDLTTIWAVFARWTVRCEMFKVEWWVGNSCVSRFTWCIMSRREHVMLKSNQTLKFPSFSRIRMLHAFRSLSLLTSPRSGGETKGSRSHYFLEVLRFCLKNGISWFGSENS